MLAFGKHLGLNGSVAESSRAQPVGQTSATTTKPTVRLIATRLPHPTRGPSASHLTERMV
jgi:hypothetical protein